MAILSREQLCSTFVNGTIPSQKDFCDLIDSALNRRDDHFFGFWQMGMKYCEGDVVIYNKSIYILRLPEASQANCPPGDDEGGANGDKNGANGEDEKSGDGCICSVIPPDEDTERWCMLQLAIDDRDWSVIEIDGEIVIVYNLTAAIGIGTENPQAPLEVTDLQNGSILLQPNDATHPSLTLIQLDGAGEKGKAAAEHQVNYQLADSAKWTTDTLGYAFVRQVKEDAETANPSQQETTEEDGQPPVLLFITSEGKQRAKVGVGTEQAQGLLHAKETGRGDMIVNPGQHAEPSLLLVNTEQGGNGHYLMSGVAQHFAYLQTDASDGFRLRKGASFADILKNSHQPPAEDLVTVNGNGEVGIGTNDPQSNLEIREEGSGTIRLDLSNDNPAISAINLRPIKDHPVTYHAFGVDDNAGTYITNAPAGFVFKCGGEYGQYDNEVNINQGDKLVFISQEGKLGVLTSGNPTSYELEVEGRAKSLTAHLETDGSNIKRTGDLLPKDPSKPKEDGVLVKLEKLNPIKFEWKQHTNASDEGEQIGFNAQNVFECFPELVKVCNGQKSVAYGNMTAVLVQAIKDQQTIIDQLEQRICDLEEQLGSGD